MEILAKYAKNYGTPKGQQNCCLFHERQLRIDHNELKFLKLVSHCHLRIPLLILVFVTSQ